MIRELTIDDFEKVEPMMAALHKIHVENRSDFYSENAHPLTKKEFKAMLKDKNKIALTFAENGEIAGIALATIKDRTVRSIYIDAIFVLEPFRRRGIATRLFRQIQDTASEIGAERMDLMVWAFNAPALAFYKSLGIGAKDCIGKTGKINGLTRFASFIYGMIIKNTPDHPVCFVFVALAMGRNETEGR